MSAGEGGDRPAAARRRPVALWLAPALVVMIAALVTYRAAWRAQHDPAFCAGSCHTPKAPVGGAAGDWHLKRHAQVACQSCHATSKTSGLKLWLTGATAKGVAPHGHVDAHACTSCHERSAAVWARVSMTQGHREHRGAKGVDCLSCHGKTSHGAEPPEKACVTCHENQRLHKASTAADAETCLSCHTYPATGKDAPAPTTVTCERCHADASKLAASAGGVAATSAPLKLVDAHVLHGGVACQLCHNAHGKKTRVPDGQPACAKCHQFEPFEAGGVEKKGPEGHRNCEGCHKPHLPVATAGKACVACHEKNAKGLILAKGAKAREPAKLLAGAVVAKTSALKHDSCASCHLPHTWRAERSACVQCHEDKASLILNRSPAAHSACTNCHEVHGPPPSGAICVTCHAKTKGRHVALAPERHKDCTSCHNPHAPLPRDTRSSCVKCHGTQATQVMHGPAGHTTCFDCHKPHDNPLPPANICGKCHEARAKIVASASPPKHRVCLSCHERHVFRITKPLAACSKCHAATFQAAATDEGKPPHQGDCKGCHTLHGSPGIAKAACFKCHAKVAAEFNPPNEKHATCRSCHRPHKPVSTARAACATCHEAKAVVATKWPPSSAHAKACITCHQQHDVRNKKACASCHAKEAASAAGGKHQCAGCHPPHKAPPGTGPAWWSRCAECHAGKVESVKQRGPTHSECKQCHQPHKFARPTCVSCHNDMAGKGLHGVEKHAASCTACHDPHVKSLPAPPQCLACHTTRRGHEPTAKQCQACHMFK